VSVRSSLGQYIRFQYYFSINKFSIISLIFPTIIIAALLATPLCADPKEPADPNIREDAPRSASRAQEQPSSSFSPATIAQFRANCIDCHDLDGRGEGGRQITQAVPDFTDLRWQGSRADEDLRRSILEGKGRSMPAMRAKIKPDDANRLVPLVRGFGGGRLVIPDQPEENPTPPKPVRPPTDKVPNPEALPSRAASVSRKNPEAIRREAAKAAFRLSCRKCHGDDGKGGSMRGLFPSIPDFTSRHWQDGTSKDQLTASILEGKSTHMPAFRSKLGTAQVDDLVAYVRAFVSSQRDSIGHQPDDFEKRLAELQKEFEELHRAYRGLSPSPRQN
jgi:mono/diheme cytochrome c family protein